MSNDAEYGETSAAVHTHLGIMQAVIQRMSSNSSSCKAWCIALVSAALVIVADNDKPQDAWIAAIPTVLFLTLDAYYLALEKGFRDSYNTFIDKLHRQGIQPQDLYAVVPAGSLFRQFFKSLWSVSVWPIYVSLMVMIYVARSFVM